jgi:hypothetical protein
MALSLGVNSYSTVADADIYFADSLGATAWTGASATDKANSLVSSSRKISLYVKDTCKLPLTPPITNVNLIVAAQELALAFLDNASLLSSVSTTKVLKRAKAGSVEVEYFQPNSAATALLTNKKVFPVNVQKLLVESECLGSAASLGNVIVSGTHGKSDQCDDYGRTQGYY